jgi:hypothetical protein
LLFFVEKVSLREKFIESEAMLLVAFIELGVLFN